MINNSSQPNRARAPTDADYQNDALFLRSVLAASGDCIKVLDLDANLIYMSEGGQKVMEVSDFNAIAGCPWPDFWQGQGNLDALDAIAAARAGGVGRFQGAADTFAGNPRYWDVQVTPILGHDGKPERLLSVSRDITALKHEEEERRLLSLELNHRIKNQMAVVQSIVNQTLRGAYPLETAKTIIGERLGTLSRAHDLLIQGKGERASIKSIIATSTQLLDTRRVKLNGPDMAIGPKAALSLSLILHELSTNAIKYGSFSVPTGTIEISWGEGQLDDQAAFEISFVEIGGPLVTPPTSRGFGSRLLQAGLSGSVSRAKLDYHPEGLQFRLAAVLATVQSEV